MEDYYQLLLNPCEALLTTFETYSDTVLRLQSEACLSLAGTQETGLNNVRV